MIINSIHFTKILLIYNLVNKIEIWYYYAIFTLCITIYLNVSSHFFYKIVRIGFLLEKMMSLIAALAFLIFIVLFYWWRYYW